MSSIEQLTQAHNQLVQMFQRDVNALQLAVNKLAAELATVKQQLVQVQNAPKVYGPGPNGPAAPATVDGQVIVGRHPVTGQPVTQEQMEKDSKLRRTMQFSEEDA